MKKHEITEALSDLLEEIAFLREDSFDEDVRSWLMVATLRIWAGNNLFSEEYPEILSVFTGKAYTTAQIITALDCAGDQSREMVIPVFFRDIVFNDKQNHSSESRTLADEVGRFLALVALVNGDFTIEEASALRGISDLLLGYCDHQGVVSGKTREHHPEMLTPLSATGYYQPAGEEKQKRTDPVENEKEEQTPNRDVPTTKVNGASPSITVNRDSVTEEPEHLVTYASSDNEADKKKSGKKKEESGETLESVLAELHGLVGLDKVKNDIQSLMNFVKICQMRTQRGMKVPTISYHLVFTGNPGTGKTTVARMVAKLYYLMGILPQGQLIETDRSGLVAGYLGQTAIKTQKVIQEALGGVLFIDEAYALANDKEDSYGKEAIETILKAMEDHRDELVVIVAGYDELMHKFIDSNPGLRSRFNKYFHFPDYDGNDLLLILKRFCDTNGYTLAEDAIPLLRDKLNEMYENREEHFGNARAVRNLFEHAINQQANRLVIDSEITDQELAELTLEDIILAMEVM